jgi:catechol 2,3-dioxygenase-like lactoylglutathione lyase family enzyme
MIRHIQIVSIPVSDQDRAKAFYAGKLGFEVRADDPMGEDRRWVALAPPKGETAIALVSWFDEMPPGSVRGLVLESDDVSRDYARLKDAGVEFARELEREEWGTYATFTDPDGNGWVLAQLNRPPRAS